jgi:PEP-CTERM motif
VSAVPEPGTLTLLGICLAGAAGSARISCGSRTTSDVLLPSHDLLSGGIVNVEGDHKTHVINIHGNRFELDTAFDVDFNRDISTWPAPH